MPPHDYLIVLGDFKAGVANSSGLYDTAIGPVTVDALNDNGEWLLNFCITHAISVTNTWFVRRDITKHTLYRNEGKTRRHWLSSVQNCRSYRGAELGNTDDCLVSSRIKLWLRANKSNSSSSKKIYISQLKQDPSVRERYMAEVSNRLEALQQCSESESAWNTFKVYVLTTATEFVDLKQRKKKGGLAARRSK
ncbi:uncharacterized protein LOC136025499 [Artemia franciscana]|uniref:uncharacterized protein LOC136025499 n=1 Tax=Artemia franciscana TaxID=6661 RepID=UPI0032DB9F4F